MLDPIGIGVVRFAKVKRGGMMSEFLKKGEELKRLPRRQGDNAIHQVMQWMKVDTTFRYAVLKIAKVNMPSFVAKDMAPQIHRKQEVVKGAEDFFSAGPGDRHDNTALSIGDLEHIKAIEQEAGLWHAFLEELDKGSSSQTFDKIMEKAPHNRTVAEQALYEAVHSVLGDEGTQKAAQNKLGMQGVKETIEVAAHNRAVELQRDMGFYINKQENLQKEESLHRSAEQRETKLHSLGEDFGVLKSIAESIKEREGERHLAQDPDSKQEKRSSTKEEKGQVIDVKKLPNHSNGRASGL